MTAELHDFVFPVLKTFIKVNMAAYFPFIVNFKNGGYGNTSSAKYSLNSGNNTKGAAESSVHSNFSNEFHNVNSNNKNLNFHEGDLMNADLVN